MSRWILLCICFIVWLLPDPASTWANDPAKIARGKAALESRAFIPPPWSAEAYKNAWKQWVPKLDKAPADYDNAFAAYYGLHPAPYKNGRYPMGLREGPQGIGVSHDCLTCHGGSILGTSYIGLGNSSLDLQALFEDLSLASGYRDKLPYTASNVRGTNEAFPMSFYLFSLRNADLGLRAKPAEWGIQYDLCEDVPAWWHLKRKKTSYHTGSANARSVRSNMQFMLDPRTKLDALKQEEAVFEDIRAYLCSLEAPEYPFDVDKKLAAQGHVLFKENCVKCHGTYGPDGEYPNKIVSLKVVGTDATRLNGFSTNYVEFYNKTWFAEEKPERFKVTNAAGYQAPPLDGIWATAPYLHNGSLPTLYDVLNSKTRPKIFTRSFATDVTAYDKTKVGWKVQLLQETLKNLPPFERRKIYDTTQPGRGNGGHTFGDDFTDDQRSAIIEYLKTL